MVKKFKLHHGKIKLQKECMVIPVEMCCLKEFQ